MRKETWSVGFACALGSFIGALCAIEIATRFTYGSWVWGIGALLGGVTAWVVVDFRHLCAGIARAWRATVNWRPDHVWWKAYVFLLAGYIAVFSNVLVMMAIAGVTRTSSYIAVTILCLFCSIVIAGAGLPNPPIWHKERTRQLEDVIDDGWRMMRNLNPIAVVYWILRSVFWMIWRIPSAAVFVLKSAGPAVKLCFASGRQFSVTTFRYVHSERRKLCFVDATIGAVVGYFLGSAVLGAAIGAMLGMVNYELVSVRWLKLAPEKSKAK